MADLEKGVTTSYVMPVQLRDRIAKVAASKGWSGSEYVRRVMIKDVQKAEVKTKKRK